MSADALKERSGDIISRRSDGSDMFMFDEAGASGVGVF